MYPRSNCMPSTISTSVSSALASSTVITPSLPTFCIASAIILPTLVSPFAANVPTFFARFSMSLTTALTAMSMPRLRSIGFMPAATDLAPSRTIAAASTVAVVVPSPAMSLVFWATSRTIWAPMFSNLSSSSISFATVTPSLVMRGAPKLLSSTTLRPLGPRVTRTALARISTPRSILSRASVENLTSLAAMPLIFPCDRTVETADGRLAPCAAEAPPTGRTVPTSKLRRSCPGARGRCQHSQQLLCLFQPPRHAIRLEHTCGASGALRHRSGVEACRESQFDGDPPGGDARNSRLHRIGQRLEFPRRLRQRGQRRPQRRATFVEQSHLAPGQRERISILHLLEHLRSPAQQLLGLFGLVQLDQD